MTNQVVQQHLKQLQQQTQQTSHEMFVCRCHAVQLLNCRPTQLSSSPSSSSSSSAAAAAAVVVQCATLISNVTATVTVTATTTTTTTTTTLCLKIVHPVIHLITRSNVDRLSYYLMIMQLRKYATK